MNGRSDQTPVADGVIGWKFAEWTTHPRRYERDAGKRSGFGVPAERESFDAFLMADCLLDSKLECSARAFSLLSQNPSVILW